MKNILLSLLSLLFFFSAAAQKDGVFEYRITSSKGPTGNLKAYFSASGSRMEMQMNIPRLTGKSVTRINIVKAETPSTIFQLDDQTKSYTTQQEKTAAEATGENKIVTMLGEEKAGGYTCIRAEVKEGAMIREFWLTKEISDYEQYNNAIGGGNTYIGSGEDYAALKKNGAEGFVVKSFLKDPRGGDITMELVKYEAKDLDAALFSIPADYKPADAGNIPESVDLNNLQHMSPEERERYIEELRKKYSDQ